jgi:hypothetical protein
MLIDLLLSKQASPLEFIDCLDNNRQIYGLINWYFKYYKTNTFISKLIKECIVKEKIQNLKPYRKIIASLFNENPNDNEILYIHSLVDSGLNKKAVDYINSFFAFSIYNLKIMVIFLIFLIVTLTQIYLYQHIYQL